MQIDFGNVSYSYPFREGSARRGVVDLNLQIGEGERIGIIGPEGAGKTTLLLLMDLLLVPDKGTVVVDGMDVWKRRDKSAGLRSRIGMQFQFPEQQFVSETVEKELLFGLPQAATELPMSPQQALDLVRLPVGFLNRSPFQLSVGEARRVAFASILIRNPDTLLLDEPTVGLDGPGKEALLNAILSQRGSGKTMVIASHDLDFLSDVTDTLAVMKDGRFIGKDQVEAVLRDPRLLALAGHEEPEIIDVLNHLSQRG